MSIQDEHDLRAQLSRLLDGVEARPAPVAATIQRGRRIRAGRRIWVAAGVAAAIAAAAVLPGVLSGPSAGPVSAKHYSVTVTELGPVAHGGVIAEGADNGKGWRVIVSGPAASPTVRAMGAIGAGSFASGSASLVGPISIESLGDTRYTTIFGPVSAAVTSVVIQLPDGERPVLTPVSWGGVRWVAAVLPAGVPVVRAVAYSGGTELVYAVPFRGDEFVAWWRPGQVGPARVTTTIGSGEVDGKSWQATASIGPWGWCYSVGGGTDCTAVAAHGKLAGQQVSMLTCAPSMGGAPASGIVFVASDVTRLMLRFSDGSSASFRAVKVAGSRVVGYAVPARVRVTSSREYGGRGQLVGSALGEAVGSEHTPGWIC